MPSASPGEGGERWISLKELAEVRGVSQHSATRLVRRHHWRRQTDNRGHVLALVPLWALEQQTDKPMGRQSAVPSAESTVVPSARPLGELSAAIETMASLLRNQLALAEGRASAAEGRLAQATDELDRSRAAALEAEERARAAEARAANLGDELDHALDARREALRRVEALEQADEARKARGRLRRTWDSWRGR
jgi:hypothetical protein